MFWSANPGNVCSSHGNTDCRQLHGFHQASIPQQLLDDPYDLQAMKGRWIADSSLQPVRKLLFIPVSKTGPRLCGCGGRKGAGAVCWAAHQEVMAQVGSVQAWWH